MNNLNLKIKLDTLEASYTQSEAKLVVSGKAQFQFYNNGENQVRTLPYRAWGQAALSLQSAGTGSIHVVSGRLNVFPPSEQNPNHSMILNITNALPITQGTLQSSIPQSNGKTVEVGNIKDIPF